MELFCTVCTFLYFCKFYIEETSIAVNTVLHQPNALTYLKNTKILFKILDKNPLCSFFLMFL
jgi:hypothetical protein